MNSGRIIPRDQVARMLAVEETLLARLERAGLIRSVDDADGVGYGPTEVGRIATIVTYRRDLGVNLAGIEMILRLKDQRDALNRTLAHVALTLREALDAPDGDEIDRDA